MSKATENLTTQKFYSDGLIKIDDLKKKVEKVGLEYSDINVTKIIVNLHNNNFNKDYIAVCKIFMDILTEEISLYNKSIKYLTKHDDKTDECKKLKEHYETKKKISTNLLSSLKKSYGEYEKHLKTLESINNQLKKDYVDELNYRNNAKIEVEYADDMKNASLEYANLIEKADTGDLKNWYKFLMDLHINPMRTFTISKNNLCNLKLIFRNPATGMMTDKENVVHISHSTSSKKAPAFSIGFKTYKAVSTGVRLLAGSLVTAAIENVPLPYLHAISLMDHASVEDLPPLDLYFIPIEQINDDGRFEVLMIKGIQFVDMNQNDNASSTGIYYSFSYFAEDIVPLDFSSLDNYLGTLKRQSLIKS